MILSKLFTCLVLNFIICRNRFKWCLAHSKPKLAITLLSGRTMKSYSSILKLKSLTEKGDAWGGLSDEHVDKGDKGKRIF